MNRFALFAAALAVAPLASAQTCEPYQKVVEAAGDEFSSIRGASVGPQTLSTIPLTGMFETLVRLPYMAECRLLYFEDQTAYTCTNVMAFESAMRGAFDSMLRDARACLSSWTPGDASRGGAPPDGFEAIESHRLEGPDSIRYLLDLSVQTYQGRKYWRLTAMFDVPRKIKAGA